MAKVVFNELETSSGNSNLFASFDVDTLKSYSQYQSKCQGIEARFRSQRSRAFTSTEDPASSYQLPSGETIYLVHTLEYTDASSFKPSDPLQEGAFFEYLEASKITSSDAVDRFLKRNYKGSLSRGQRRNIADRYHLYRRQKEAGGAVVQGFGADTSGITYGEVWKATQGQTTPQQITAAIQSLKPGIDSKKAKEIYREFQKYDSSLKGTSQDFTAISIAPGGDITRTDVYSHSLDNSVPEKNGVAFTLGTVGQLAREMLESNKKFDLRSEDFRDIIAAKFGVNSREAGYYQSQYLDQTPDMASLLRAPDYAQAPENIVGYNQALQDLPQSGQTDPSNQAFQRKSFNFDSNERIWREIRKLAGGYQGKRATQILQQLIRTAPGASQDYIIEQARKFDPNIGEQIFKSRFNAVREASIERGLFADNDEAGQRIVDAHFRALELAGKSDEEKVALYDQLEKSGQIEAFKTRKASAFERANPLSKYNRRKAALESEYKTVETEKQQYEAQGLKEESEQAEKKLTEIKGELDKIAEGYAEWLSDNEKLNLINDQIIKTLEQTSDAIDPGTGKADSKYRFDADVQKTIDSSGKESTIVEGAAEKRKRSTVEEQEAKMSPELKAYLESVSAKNEARVARWSQQGAKIGSLFGTKGGNIGASIGGSAAKLAGAFSTLATGVGVVVAAGQLLASGFKKLYGAAEEAVQKMLDVAKYDGNLLATNILHKGREFRRTQRFARETSETGVALVNAYDDFQEELLPLKIAWQKFKNTVGTWFLEVATSLMKAVNYILKFWGIFNLANRMGEQSSNAPVGRFSDPNSSGNGQGGQDGQPPAPSRHSINIETGDYTAYDETGKMTTKEQQARNKQLAIEYAKKLGVNLKDVQNNEEFVWRLANYQEMELAKDEEGGVRGAARRGAKATKKGTSTVARFSPFSALGIAARVIGAEAGIVDKQLDKGGHLGLTEDEVKRLNAGKNVRAIETAAGVVDGKVKGELGLSIKSDILNEEGAYSEGGKSLNHNANTQAIAAQAQLFKTYYDSERRTGKGIVDEEMLRQLDPEGMKKDRQGTIDAFIKKAKENREENELAIFYNQMVNRAGDKEAEWTGYQTLDPEKISKSALEDLAASSDNQAIKLDAVARFLEQMLGYNREIADNTKPKDELDPTSDLIFSMMGKISSRTITDPGAPQGVDMSSYSNENKQYGRFAGQHNTTYWGRPEKKK